MSASSTISNILERDTKHRIARIFFMYSVLILSIFTTACSNTSEQQISKISGPTMGTQYHISWVSNKQDSHDLALEAKAIQDQVDQLLIAFNKSMSTYDPQSELSLLNHNFKLGWQEISEDLYTVLQMSLDINKQSNKAFDVTVGPLVNLWGFGPDKRQFQAPSQQDIDALLGQVGSEALELRTTESGLFQLRLKQARYIDLSAIAKGYAVDVLGILLQNQGIDQYLVEVGGEIIANGVKPKQQPWRIAIEAPNDDGRSIQIIIPLSNMGVATSGDYRNFFEQEGHRFSHTIDGRTGKPVEHNLASVSVLHESVGMADAWATALTVLGAAEGLALAEKYGLAAYFIVRTEGGYQQISSSQFEQLRLN